MSTESEVLTFKQRGGESLKDAWYRINDAQRRSTKKQSTHILLRNFYIGITSWYKYILDTITGGNFLGTQVREGYLAIENLVGAPPPDEIKTEITLENVMEKLEFVEKNMPSLEKINEIDKKVLSCMSKIDRD